MVISLLLMRGNGKRSVPAWGGENCLYLSDFGNETDTTFVPCILLFSPKEGRNISAQGNALGQFFVKALKEQNISIIGAYVSLF
jgi:hypothetical protein